MREVNENKSSGEKQEKKHYSAPKIDLIVDVRKVTRGGGNKANDMAGKDRFGGPPSDPGRFPP